MRRTYILARLSQPAVFGGLSGICVRRTALTAAAGCAVHLSARERSPRCLGGLLQRQVPIDRRLEVHVTGERGGIGEREDLRRPEAADAVLAVDPVEEIGEARP